MTIAWECSDAHRLNWIRLEPNNDAHHVNRPLPITDSWSKGLLRLSITSVGDDGRPRQSGRQACRFIVHMRPRGLLYWPIVVHAKP